MPRCSAVREADEHFRWTLYRLLNVVLGLCRVQLGLGAVTMDAFGIGSSGWPVAPGSGSSSHYARYGLSRCAFIGDAAAAVAGPFWATGCRGLPSHYLRQIQPARRASLASSAARGTGFSPAGPPDTPYGYAVVASYRPLDGRQKEKS